MDIKSGWKTTEFWTSISSALVGLLFIFGIFTKEETTGILQATESIIGGVMMIVPTVAYAISRGKAKQGTIDMATLIEALSNIVVEETPTVPEDDSQ